MRFPKFLLILVVVGVACALNVFLILRPKPVGLPEPAGLVCTITLGGCWDIYDYQLDMAALSRIGIGYDEMLAVQAHQVVPWVVTWVEPPVGATCVGHGCGGSPSLRAYQVAAPAPLELVGSLCWQVFSPLELAAAPLEVGGHPTCPFCHVWGLSAL